MNRSRFLTLSLSLAIIFLFGKIYQHNKIVKLMYKKQKIQRQKEKLEKKKNNLLVELYKLKDQTLVRKRAQEELGMEQLKPKQIVVLGMTCTDRV